ncbi:MAG: hypothetical protein J7539_06210 [Niabella sp.]|nr:hypothetical protein [Niabella sp.]
MKYLAFVTILAVYCSFTFGQTHVLLLSTPSYKYHSEPNPDVIDTSSIKKLNDKFYLGKARLDNMPVLLPHNEKRNMPNPGLKVLPPEHMPNFWGKPEADPDKTIRENKPYRFYHLPDSTLYRKFDYRKKTGPLYPLPYNKQD